MREELAILAAKKGRFGINPFERDAVQCNDGNGKVATYGAIAWHRRLISSRECRRLIRFRKSIIFPEEIRAV